MSLLEDTLATHIRLAGLPEPKRELVFAKPRRWRFDLAWPDRMIAVEVEGGIWLDGGGRHNRGAGLENDIRKYNEAVRLGWALYRVTGGMIESGEALGLLREVLK